MENSRRGINRIHPLKFAEGRALGRIEAGRHHAVKCVGHILRGQFFSIVELDPAQQMKRVGLLGIINFPPLSQLGNDFESLVPPHQKVKEELLNASGFRTVRASRIEGDGRRFQSNDKRPFRRSPSTYTRNGKYDRTQTGERKQPSDAGGSAEAVV
jgi:hypothetical protein